ncbi:MAG: B12-binding domain-containing radical SAM protein [bacterium]|nr:B12-binding domain-containing radical SAM protein [bacterium]
MAKLVLVNHWSPGIGNDKLPLGLGYLASYLKKYLDFDDIAIVNTGERTLEKIIAHQPDIVGFTAYTAGYYDVLQLMEQVKSQTSAIILAGGPHITCLPHKLSRFTDIGIIGEGEQTLLELMHVYLAKGKLRPDDLRPISGIVFWNYEKLEFTSPRELIRPIDRIPMPARDLFDMEYFLKPSQILMNNEFLRGTTMLTSRGCPYHCIYCHVSSKWGKPRLHSPDYVVSEMEHLVNTYNVEAITVSDDLFISSAKRIESIVEKMEQRKLLGKIRFLVDLRANLVNDHLVQLLKKMGVVKAALGLESGSDRILQYLKGKNVTVADNRNAVKILNNYGIGTHCCFMIGAPPETKEDIELTRNLIREILDMDTKNFCQLTVTTPLPGTQLWNYARNKEHITEDVDWHQFSLSPLVSNRKDFFINEHIDFDEFLQIAADTFALTNSRRLKSILSKFSWRYVRRIFEDPKLAMKIVRDYLKYH